MTSSPRQRLPGTPAPTHLWPGAQGVLLAADAWGPADGQPVLMLPGGGQTRHSWRATGRLLAAAGYHAVALDLRGHGDSGWSAQGHYGQDHFVQDLQAVVAALGGRRPVLMGASLGGNICLVAAGEGHLDTRALILVDIVPRSERAGFDRVHAFMTSRPEGFASLDEVADAIAQFRGDGRRPSKPDSLARAVRRAPDGRLHWHWDPRFMDSREADFASRGARLAACAQQLRVPALLVRGGSSDVVSEQGAQEFLALCPQAEYVNVAGAGHMLTADSNEVFGRATIDFLARHAPADPTGSGSITGQ